MIWLEAMLPGPVRNRLATLNKASPDSCEFGLLAVVFRDVVHLYEGRFMLAPTLLDLLGLRLTITPFHPRLNPKVSKEKPLVVAGRTASTSYVGQLLPEGVGDVLLPVSFH